MLGIIRQAFVFNLSDALKVLVEVDFAVEVASFISGLQVLLRERLLEMSFAALAYLPHLFSLRVLGFVSLRVSRRVQRRPRPSLCRFASSNNSHGLEHGCVWLSVHQLVSQSMRRAVVGE